jgi:DNA-directed RNA polymerase alpha subunit
VKEENSTGIIGVSEDVNYQSIENIENLSIRTYNVLKRAGINGVNDILKLSKEDLFKIKGMSRFSHEELEKRLKIDFE